MSEPSNDDLFTASSAARLCNVAPATVKYWERLGILPAQRTVEGVRIFRRGDLERVLAEREQRRSARSNRAPEVR